MSYKHYTDLPEELQTCTRTELQWAKAGYVPKEADSGMVLWTNRYHTMKKRYLSNDQVRPGTADELEAIVCHFNKRRIEGQQIVIRGLSAQIERLEQQYEEATARVFQVEAEAQGRLKCAAEAYRKLLRRTLFERTSPAQTYPPSIVLDIETTGLEPTYDEVLQIAIIDAENGSIVLNTYVRPIWTFRWDEAQQINGISPEAVAAAPTMDVLLPQLNDIIGRAHEIIGYGISFDLLFLKQYGIELRQQKIVDVMHEFALFLEERDTQNEDAEWQSLSRCAAYFGYDWEHSRAHDSLADCNATLFCYNAMKVPE